MSTPPDALQRIAEIKESSRRWRSENLPNEQTLQVATVVQAFAANMAALGVTVRAVEIEKLWQVYDTKPNKAGVDLEVLTVAGEVAIREKSSAVHEMQADRLR